MKAEFEKARDEIVEEAYLDNEIGHKNIDKAMQAIAKKGVRVGADWAYEWLEHRLRRMVPDHEVRKLEKAYQTLSSEQHKQLDQQAKIIEELKEKAKTLETLQSLIDKYLHDESMSYVEFKRLVAVILGEPK